MADYLQIDQQVIHNNKEIFSRLHSELMSAQSEILVAVAWFTDDELFQILIEKAGLGLRVEVILAENSENEKLDFNLLKQRGATILKVKNVGYGLMHQKFCVIDGKKALHGSYNWSMNAKNNNHESIIVTDHKDTVESLIKNFHDIKQRAIAIAAGGDILYNKQPFVPTKPEPVVSDSESVQDDYEKVLDSMIAAEVSSFDRERLRGQGYDKAKSNNGDQHVIKRALDSLYNGFLNDIDVIEDKKKRLLAKIDEQKAKAENIIKEKAELKIETTKQEIEITQNNLNNKIINLRSEILINQSLVTDLRENKIPTLKQKVHDIEQAIRDSMIQFVKPAIKWFELGTVSVFAFGLLIYLLMFYSSAAYILLYSEQDAMITMSTSSEVITPQVFEPEAFSKAAEHGWPAIVFVALFVLLPLTFAILSRVVASKESAKLWSFIGGVVVIDCFIAVKVAKAIHEIHRLTDLNIPPWSPSDVLVDINFYLVFILGALGLLLFKFCYEKIADFFDDRNPDIATQRNNLRIKHQREEIAVLQEDNAKLTIEVQNNEQDIFLKTAQIGLCEKELAELPLKQVSQLESRQTDMKSKIQIIQITTDIYKSHIENDNFPISVDALKDRIAVFLDGWNDWLHQEFSVLKASQKSAEATEVCMAWEAEKLSRSGIDKRIKIQP